MSEIHCPNYRKWHQVHLDAIGSTPYADAVMFFECRGYAGQRGVPSRHWSRHPKGYHQPVPGPFRIVQPWGPRKGVEATFISEHATVVEAFAEIDRLSAQMVRTGAPTAAVELLAVDADGAIGRRQAGEPRPHSTELLSAGRRGRYANTI